MKMRKFKPSLLIVFCLASAKIFGQGSGDWLSNTMFSSGKINVVVSVIAAIFILIVLYLVSIDRKLRKMEDTNSKDIK